MKLALISPIEHLNVSQEFSDIHMVLAHLLNHPKYRNFYKGLKNVQQDAFVICDNSANEGFMIKDKQILSLAEKINADEIVAPDKYHDADITIYETKKFLETYFDSDIKDKYTVMAVPQGNNIEEFMKCYNAFLEDDRINTLGLGYRNLVPAFSDEMFVLTDSDWIDLGIDEIEILQNRLEDNCFNYTLSRFFFLKSFVNFRSLKKHNKKIHLLGLYNPYELSIINKTLTRTQLQGIRSCDSASPWQAAQCGILFNSDFGVVAKPKQYLDFEHISEVGEINVLEKNLKIIKKWAKHKIG